MMIPFTLYEIMVAIFGSIIFGISFSIVFAILGQIAILPDYLFLIFNKSSFKEFAKCDKIPCGFWLIMVMFILYAVGFVLMSYCFLDGCVRAYMLCISLFVFFVTKKLAFRAVKAMIFIIGNVLFFIPAKIWRRKHY